MTQPIPPTDVDPESLARLFHETYERLAPDFGYRTREASAKPWADVPEQNRALMVATCTAVVDALARAGRLHGEHAFVIGDRAATTMLGFFEQPECRVEGVVTALADDGFVTVEVEQPGASPMVITAPAADFVFVERSSRLLSEGPETREVEAFQEGKNEGRREAAAAIRARAARYVGAQFRYFEMCARIADGQGPAPSPSIEETPRVE